MTSKGKRSVRPGLSKGRKPTFRSTDPQGTKSKKPKVDASPNKGAASSIRFFIGDYNGGPTGKMVGYIPFDGDKCGFVDLPYDPRVRGLKATEPKRKPRQYTDPSIEVGVPIEGFDNITDAIKAMSRFLQPKDRTDGTKVVEPKMRKSMAVEELGQNTNSPHEVVVPFELLNLEDDSRDGKL